MDIMNQISGSYEHKVQYYETDQMGIVHHSNYIRWFEEARTDLMDKLGFGYSKMEESGILLPVLAASAEYKHPAQYGEIVRIIPHVTEFTGVKLTVSYVVENAVSGERKATGETRHGFINQKMSPVRLKRDYPEIYQIFLELLESGKR